MLNQHQILSKLFNFKKSFNYTTKNENYRIPNREENGCTKEKKKKTYLKRLEHNNPLLILHPHKYISINNAKSAKKRVNPNN